ncbi:MAG TPA: UDP-N-acetylmuramate dehydrogenase, partial [Verrucomicrobiae bacterium]|nr:UDP-N-acetylmuramate dehydrogenase [Verrucomicrobiae bacterium]
RPDTAARAPVRTGLRTKLAIRMNAKASAIPETRAAAHDAAAELAAQVSSRTVIRSDEPLAKRTTLRVGGPADIFVEPVSEEDLSQVARFCKEHNLPLLVLGRGSNLLVRDGGIRGVVVCLSHLFFCRVEVKGRQLHCGAGAKLKAAAMEAKRQGVAGLEFLEGIPGSVGGALRMNAGAMGGAIFDVVRSVRLMDLGGQVVERKISELEIKYRGCPTLKTHIALGARLEGQPGSRQEIEQRMNQFSQKRWQSQPAAPSAGCIFKNPPTVPAGKLIDELGLKGTRVGGALVSAEHGNFIINDGTATARDVLELIELIRERARAARGIELETEVEIIGE